MSCLPVQIKICNFVKVTQVSFQMSDHVFTYRYPHPAVTADCVVFGFDGFRLRVLLVERGFEPYKGCWAFPGGFMNIDETAEQCAARELQEETGLSDAYLEQFRTFTTVSRDPRERVITIAFLALVNIVEVHAGDDALKAEWFDIDKLPELAFDHNEILQCAKETLRQRIYFEPIGFELLPDKFSMSQLQRLYEAILGVKFDRRNFSKKMLHLGILQPFATDGKIQSKRETMTYGFNKECYEKLKQSGFRFEF